MIKYVFWLPSDVPLLLSGFGETLIFSTVSKKKILKYQISRKSAQWEPSFDSCGGTDRHAYMKKLIVTFRP